MATNSEFVGRYFEEQLEEHIAVGIATRAVLCDSFAELTALCARAIVDGGRLLLFGNGGSAADAQHIATEFSVRFKTNRSALPALALTSDGPTITAIGNDLGFDRVFSRQIEAHGRRGDVAIGLSTSGRSRNIVMALTVARELGLTAAAFGGGDGGDLRGIADPLLLVPSDTTARIQEVHHMLGQMLCGAVEIALGLAPWGEANA